MRQQLKCSHYDRDGHLVDQCFYLHGFPVAYKAQASTPQPYKDSPQNRQHSQLKNITRSCPYWKKKMVITNPLYVNMSAMIAHSCHSAQQYPMKYVGLWTVVRLTISPSRHQYTMRSIIVIM